MRHLSHPPFLRIKPANTAELLGATRYVAQSVYRLRESPEDQRCVRTLLASDDVVAALPPFVSTLYQNSGPPAHLLPCSARIRACRLLMLFIPTKMLWAQLQGRCIVSGSTVVYICVRRESLQDSCARAEGGSIIETRPDAPICICVSGL